MKLAYMAFVAFVGGLAFLTLFIADRQQMRLWDASRRII